MSLLCRSFITWRLAQVAALVVLLVPSTVHAAVVINPLSWGLNPGDTFRLAVVTAGGTTGSSTSTNDYDAFVNSQGLSGITYGGASLTWQAIAGTPSSNPRTDSSRFSSQANAIRVFNLNGALVSNVTNGSAFWQTSGFNQHLAAIDWTINGSGNLAQVNGSQLVWTGFDIDGSPATANAYDSSGFPTGTVTAALGQTVPYNSYDFMNSQVVPSTLYPLAGRAGASANGWAALSNDPLATVYPLYAMSQVITVVAVPEPSTIAMALAGLGGGGFCMLRRRRWLGGRAKR
jgi:hypothetical protein